MIVNPSDIAHRIELLDKRLQKEVKNAISIMVKYLYLKNKYSGRYKLISGYAEEANVNIELYSNFGKNTQAFDFLQAQGVLKYKDIYDHTTHYSDGGTIIITIKKVEDIISLQEILVSDKKHEYASQITGDNEKYTYTIEYNEFQLEIQINGIKFHKLSLNGKNTIIFDYIYKNPNKDISYDDLKEKAGLHKDKTITNFLKDISMNVVFKDLFFPKTTDKQIYFRNPVTIIIPPQESNK